MPAFKATCWQARDSVDTLISTENALEVGRFRAPYAHRICGICPFPRAKDKMAQDCAQGFECERVACTDMLLPSTLQKHLRV